MAEEQKVMMKLVEKTEGPWKGRVWRCCEMTAEEAELVNGRIEVMQWEPVVQVNAGGGERRQEVWT